MHSGVDWVSILAMSLETWHFGIHHTFIEITGHRC